MNGTEIHNDDDINGLEFTASSSTSSGSGDWKNIDDQPMNIEELTLYPGILTEVKPDTDQWGKCLRFYFELQGRRFTYKDKNGKHYQQRVHTKTSYATGAKSGLRKLYQKLVGREISDNEKMRIAPLVGTHVELTIKIAKGKPNAEGFTRNWYNLDNLKLRPLTPNVLATPVAAAPVQQPVQPAVVAKVQEAAPASVPAPQPVKQEAAQTQPVVAPVQVAPITASPAVKDFFSELE